MLVKRERCIEEPTVYGFCLDLWSVKLKKVGLFINIYEIRFGFHLTGGSISMSILRLVESLTL